MKKCAVLFDLDGTLLDTLDDLADSVNAALAQKGYPLRTREEVRVFVGNGIADLIRRSVPAGTSAADEADCLAAFRAYYAEHLACRSLPYPGVEELLERLHRAGIACGVVSNKINSAVETLCAHYFGDRIDAAVGECEGLRRKPEPDTLFKAMKQMEVEPPMCVYVGDSDVDIRTAANAGIPCISVTWGFRPVEFLQEHGATCLVSDTEALYRALIDALPLA